MNGEAVIAAVPAVRSRAPFLTAVWSHLFMASFAVPDDAVLPYMPPGTEPDRWEGSAMASIVAFDFQDTRVRGASVPGFRSFPEWNLRIYARHGEDRGVVFVREFVPNAVVAGIARAVYNEPYSVARFASERQENGKSFSITHRMTAAAITHTVCVEAALPPIPAPVEGIVPFIKDQIWGFGQTRSHRLIRYRVEHAPWRIYPVLSWSLDVDYARLYGERWAFLKDATPTSVLLAEGSPTTVYTREIIRQAQPR